LFWGVVKTRADGFFLPSLLEHFRRKFEETAS